MLRFITTLLVLTLSTMHAHAEIKTERIEYKHADTTMRGLLAYDTAIEGKRPGVLVCHEWWGNNDYSESRARQLAGLGYVAFALDVYGDGKTTTKPDEAGAMLGKLMADNKVLRERAAAGLKVLADHPRVDSGRLAAIGYCMGGTVALELGRSGLPHTADLKAIVCFHTSTIAAKEAPDNNNIQASLLVCHGAADTFVPPAQIEQFHRQMAESKIDYQFVTYSAAVHAFTNPAADAYKVPGVKHDANADRRSWETMKALFAEVLSR